jgi:hypothetical protein
MFAVHSKTMIDANHPKTREEGSLTHGEAPTQTNLQSPSLDLSPHDIISETSINTSTIYLSPNVRQVLKCICSRIASL